MSNSVTFTPPGALAGARDALPLTPGVFLFGMLFGVLAGNAGLSALEAGLMSTLVMAGASQFAVIQIWAEPVPVLTIVLAAAAINARHLVMGAVLAPWLASIGKLRAYVSLFFLVDESWGLSAANLKRGGMDAAYLIGSGSTLYLCWISGTLAGRLSGGLVPDPAAIALDVLPTYLFLALLMGFWHGTASLIPWLVAAAVAYVGDAAGGQGWPVLAGAVAGALAGAFADGARKPEDAQP